MPPIRSSVDGRAGAITRSSEDAFHLAARNLAAQRATLQARINAITTRLAAPGGHKQGRARYEQLKGLGRRVADSPAAQQAAGAVQAQAAGLAQAAKQKVADGLHDRVPKMAGTARSKVGDHVPGLRKNGSSRHSDGNGSAEAPGDRPVAATSEQDGKSG